MTLINKKRMGIMISCIMLALFTFSFQIANINQQSEELNLAQTIETTSTPVSGKTVILDARASELQTKRVAYCIEKIKVTIYKK